MKFLTVGLILAIYFPIFGRVIPAMAALPFNLINYGLVLCFGVGIVSLFGVRHAPATESPWFRWVSRFFALLLAQYFVRVLIPDQTAYDVGQAFRNHSAGIFFAVTTMLLIRRELLLNRRTGALFETAALVLSVALLLQGIGSMVESRRGQFLGEYEQEQTMALEGRNLLAALGDARLERLGFNLAFTGLMGQHNRFGTMLIYVNLIFLIQLLRSRNPYYLGMVGFVALLAVGNTTKTAIGAIALSDVLLLPAVYSTIRWLRVTMLIVGFVVGGTVYGPKIVEAVTTLGVEGSWLSRLDYWVYLREEWLRLLPESPLAILFGLPFGALAQLSVGYNEVINKSFESEFLACLFRDGLVGTVAYVTLLVGAAVSIRRHTGQARLTLIALNVCLLLSSFLMDFQLRYHNVTLICLILYGAYELLPVPGENPSGRPSPAARMPRDIQVAGRDPA